MEKFNLIFLNNFSLYLWAMQNFVTKYGLKKIVEARIIFDFFRKLLKQFWILFINCKFKVLNSKESAKIQAFAKKYYVFDGKCFMLFKWFRSKMKTTLKSKVLEKIQVKLQRTFIIRLLQSQLFAPKRRDKQKMDQNDVKSQTPEKFQLLMW